MTKTPPTVFFPKNTKKEPKKYKTQPKTKILVLVW